MEDHHVDRPEVEAGQPAQLTGTNRSNELDPRRNPVPPDARPRIAARPSFPASAGKRPPVKTGAQGLTKTLPHPLTSHPGHITHPTQGALGRPGGHSEGPNTRSHPELGRENPQRRWYSVLRRGRVGHRQVFQQPTTHPINSARQLRARARTAHRMLTACDLVRLITVTRLGRAQRALAAVTPPRRRGPSSRAHRGVEQPGSSSGS